MPQAGRYQLLDRIATGGMAELYRGRTLGAKGFSKVVAIKRILPHLANDETFVQMLIAEARMAANLSHPNIAQVIELGQDAQGYFIVMEFVNGPNLAALLRRLGEQGRTLPHPCALDVVIQLLHALDHAHKLLDANGRPQSIIHQDVSPENLIICANGVVKLTDFGVAKVKTFHETRTKGVRGKLPYMSPEQIAGKDVDARTDIFAAGLVLWESLTGRIHYDAETDGDLMAQVEEGRARKLSEVGVKAAPEIEAALAKALARNPEERYQSASAFADDLMVYHRRAYPAHSPAVLGGIVGELFKAQFDTLAERLRRFERGEAAPAGTVGENEPLVATAELEAQGESRRPARASRPGLARPESWTTGTAHAPTQELTAARLAPLASADEDEDEEDTSPSARTREATNLPAQLLMGLALLLAVGAAVLLFITRRTQPPPEVAPVAVVEPAPVEEVDAGEAEDTPKRREPPPKRVEKKVEPTPAAFEKGTGYLDLDCRPDCEIEIDGKRVGSSPLRGHPLEAGVHRVNVVNRFVNLRKQKTVEIRAGKTTVRSINLVTDF